MGKLRVYCLKTLKKLSIYPLGNTPSAPSDWSPSVASSSPWFPMNGFVGYCCFFSYLFGWFRPTFCFPFGPLDSSDLSSVFSSGIPMNGFIGLLLFLLVSPGF